MGLALCNLVFWVFLYTTRLSVIDYLSTTIDSDTCSAVIGVAPAEAPSRPLLQQCCYSTKIIPCRCVRLNSCGQLLYTWELLYHRWNGVCRAILDLDPRASWDFPLVPPAGADSITGPRRWQHISTNSNRCIYDAIMIAVLQDRRLVIALYDYSSGSLSTVPHLLRWSIPGWGDDCGVSLAPSRAT